MTKKSTKKALLLSVLSLVLCCALLAGTTFAWFTDSVVSMNNIIKSGSLDVVLEYRTSWADGTDWVEVTDTTKIFDDAALYEPGYTEVVFLRVSNAGTLDLKAQLSANIVSEKSSTNVYGNEFFLSDYLEIGTYTMAQYNGTNDYSVLWPFMFGSRAAALSAAQNWTKLADFSGIAMSDTPILAGEYGAQIMALVLTMPETVGNEANHKSDVDAPEVTFGINLVATQLASEEDTFGPDYDEDATYPVTNATELKDALAAGGSVVLADDVFVEETLAIPAGKQVTLDLNGKELSGAFTQQGVSALIQNRGVLTVKNGTVVSLAENPDTDWNPEGFPTYASNTISNSGVLFVEEGTVIENKTNVGGASYAIDNYAGATLVVNGGEIKAQDVAIRINTASTTLENNVMINGGTITGKRAIWVHIAGSNAAQAPVVNLVINGGDFNSTSDFTIYSFSYGQSFSNVNVTINGGDFEKNVAFGGGYKGDQENVTVTGGTFNGYLGRYLAGDAWEDIAKP